MRSFLSALFGYGVLAWVLLIIAVTVVGGNPSWFEPTVLIGVAVISAVLVGRSIMAAIGRRPDPSDPS